MADCGCMEAFARALEQAEAQRESQYGAEAPYWMEHFELPCEVCGDPAGYLHMEEVLLCYKCYRVMVED